MFINMKLLTLAASVAVFTSPAIAAPRNATDVAVYECTFGRQKFAAKSEKRQSDRDPDPIVKIDVTTWINPDDTPGMSIEHVSESGRRFDRASQYPINSLMSRGNAFVWKGRYDRDPEIIMIGTLRRDRRDVTYTETRIDHGKVMWNNVTNCQ